MDAHAIANQLLEQRMTKQRLMSLVEPEMVWVAVGWPDGDDYAIFAALSEDEAYEKIARTYSHTHGFMRVDPHQVIGLERPVVSVGVIFSPDGWTTRVGATRADLDAELARTYRPLWLERSQEPPPTDPRVFVERYFDEISADTLVVEEVSL